MKRRHRNWRKAFRPSKGWLVVVAIFIAHQVLQHGLGIALKLLDNYLDPLLSVPIFIGIAQAERRYLMGEGAGFRLSILECIGLTIVLALIGEFVFPLLDPSRQTHDPLDFLSYALGGAVSIGYLFWVDPYRGFEIRN